VTQKMFSSTST